MYAPEAFSSGQKELAPLHIYPIFLVKGDL
jgi:hypothetical protein